MCLCKFSTQEDEVSVASVFMVAVLLVIVLEAELGSVEKCLQLDWIRSGATSCDPVPRCHVYTLIINKVAHGHGHQ